MKKHLFFFSMLLLPSLLFSQDTIVHRNGGVFIVDLIREENHRVVYKLWDQPQSRTFHLAKSSIFSIKKSSGKKEIIYKYNPEIGNIYQVDEMRLFIKGEQDAQEYNSPISNLISIVGGASGGYVLGSGGILGVTAPVVLPAMISIFKPRVKERTVRDERFFSITAYKKGYLREAKKKRYFKNLVLSSISLGISTAITALAKD